MVRGLKAAIVGLAVSMALGGLVGLASAGSQDGAWREEAMGVPPPRVGDRGYYSLRTDGDEASEPLRRIAFEWKKPETLRDPAGAEHAVSVLSTQWLDGQGTLVQPDNASRGLMPNADRLYGAGNGLVALRDSTVINGTFYVQYTGVMGTWLFNYEYPWEYRHDRVSFASAERRPVDAMCGLRHGLQGVAQRLDSFQLVLENCELFGKRVERAEFRPEDAIRLDGHAATAFTGPVAGGTVRFWLDADIPYPIRWEYHPASGGAQTLTLDGFEAGQGPPADRPGTSQPFAPRSLRTAAANFTGPDSTGIPHPFPLWRAWAEAQAYGDPDLDAFMEGHPNAYMEAALFYEDHSNESTTRATYRTVAHEWFMALTDGSERFYVEVTEQTRESDGPAEPVLPGTGIGSKPPSTQVDVWAHMTLDCKVKSAYYCPYLPGYESSRPLPPESALRSYPPVTELYAAWSQAHVGGRPNGWGFCVPCHDGTQALAAAATDYQSRGDFHEVVVEGYRRGGWGVELKSLWTDPEGKPVNTAVYAEWIEPVEPTLGPLTAPPVARSNDVRLSTLATSPARWALPTAGAAAAAVAAGALAGLLYFAWPFLKSGVWNLFTRIDSPRLLAHPTRAAIHDFVTARPGATYTDIQKGLSLPNGVAQHHLGHLLRGGLLNERRGAKHRVFFVAGATDRRVMDAGVAVASEATRRILEVVAAEPGISSGQVSKRIGVSRQTVHHHVRRLVSAGLLLREPSGLRIQLTLSALGEQSLARAPAAA